VREKEGERNRQRKPRSDSESEGEKRRESVHKGESKNEGGRGGQRDRASEWREVEREK